jgi:hypothetical protein
MTADWQTKDPRWKTYALLTHYAPEVAAAAGRVAALPETLQGEFRARILAADDPVAAAPRIADDLAVRHDRAMHPLRDPVANGVLRELRAGHGDAAAAEYIEVMGLLGRSADPQAVADRVRARFPPGAAGPVDAPRPPALRSWWHDGGDRLTLAVLAIAATCAGAIVLGQTISRAIEAGSPPARAAGLTG